MKTDTFDVIVGNIGNVYHGNSSEHAYEVYASYVQLSRNNVGRAAGETVTLLNGDDIECEHIGTQQGGEN